MTLWVTTEMLLLPSLFDDTTPAGFSIVEEEPEVLSSDGFRHTINKSDLTTLQERGNKWLEQHFSPSSSSSYFYYYLYAFERYAAFRELAENKHQASPGWYNRVANNLLETQKEDGSWSGSLGAVVDTAYSILFLTRSTARTFQKIRDKRYGGGNMRGGRGLPKLTDLLKIEDGQVVSLSEMGDSSQLMDQLTRLEGTDDEALAQLADLPASDVEQLLQKNKTQIKRLVGHENAEQRFAAVQLFAKSGDVTNAPVLIYALTDPNPDIAQAALESGWGKSAPGNMFFGVKASKTTPENKKQLLATVEVLSDEKQGYRFPEVISSP